MKKHPKETRKGPAKGKKPSKQELSGDELWRAFTAEIDPLTERNRFVDLSAIEKAEVLVGSKAVKTTPRRLPSTVMKKTAEIKAPFVHGKGDGLDRASQRKMRRGKVAIEGRLDLHGMTQTEAHRNLVGFLERAYLSDKRTVLVITGKGFSRLGEPGILRQAVPRWLNEMPMQGWIRGFDHAAPPDGGEGALYILLRRKR